jgi:hypothetical protein
MQESFNVLILFAGTRVVDLSESRLKRPRMHPFISPEPESPPLLPFLVKNHLQYYCLYYCKDLQLYGNHRNAFSPEIIVGTCRNTASRGLSQPPVLGGAGAGIHVSPNTTRLLHLWRRSRNVAGSRSGRRGAHVDRFSSVRYRTGARAARSCLRPPHGSGSRFAVRPLIRLLHYALPSCTRSPRISVVVRDVQPAPCRPTATIPSGEVFSCRRQGHVA